MINARNNYCTAPCTEPEFFRAVAHSNDTGMTFSPRRTDFGLPEPHKGQAGLVRHGPLVFFTKPTGGAPGAPWPNSTRLALKVSRDEARSWAEHAVLWDGPAAYSTPSAGGPRCWLSLSSTSLRRAQCPGAGTKSGWSRAWSRPACMTMLPKHGNLSTTTRFGRYHN